MSYKNNFSEQNFWTSSRAREDCVPPPSQGKDPGNEANINQV